MMGENAQLVSAKSAVIDVESAASFAAVDVTDTLDVDVASGAATFNGSVDAADIDIATSNGIAVKAAMTADNGLSLISDAGDITVDAVTVAAKSGNASISGTAINFASDSILDVAGDLSLSSTASDISMGEINAASADINSAGAVDFNGDLTSSNMLDVLAADAVTLAASTILDGGDVNITADSFVMADSSQLLSKAGAKVTVDSLAIFAALNVVDILDVDVSTGVAAFNGVVTAKDIDVNANSGIALHAAMIAENALSLISDTGDITVDAVTVAAKSGNASISGTGIDFASDSILDVAGDLSLSSTASDIAMGEINAGSTDINSAGAVDFNGDVTTSNMLDVLAADTVTLAAGKILDGGDMNLAANSFVMADNSQLLSKAGAKIAADATATLASIKVAEALNVTANNVSFNGAVAAKDVLTLAGEGIQINADMAVTNTLLLNTTKGNITANNANVTTETSDVSLAATGLLFSADSSLNVAGDLAMDAGTNGITMGSVIANSISMNSTENIALFGDVASTNQLSIVAGNVVSVAAGKSLNASVVGVTAKRLTMADGSSLQADKNVTVSVSGLATMDGVTAGQTLHILADSASFNGVINANDIDVQVANGIEINADMTAVESLLLKTAAGNISATDAALTTSTSDLTLSATGLLFAAQSSLTVAGDLTLDAGENGLSMGDIDAQSATINSDSTVALLGDVTTSNGVDITAVNNVILASNKTIAASDFTVTAANFAMAESSQLSLSNNASIVVTNAIELGAINADNAVTVTGETVVFNGEVNAGHVDVQVQKGINIAADLTASNNLTLNTVSGNITADNATITAQSSDVNLIADGVLFDKESSLAVAGDLLVDAGVNGITMGDVKAQSVVMESEAGVTLMGDMNIATSLDVNAADVLEIHQTTVGSDMHLSSTNNAISLQGDVVAGAQVTLSANDSITLIDGMKLTSASHLSVHADSLIMGLDSGIETEGAIHIATTNDIHVSNMLSHHNAADAFVISSEAGGIYGIDTTTLQNGIHLKATGEQARATLSTATGIGNPLVVDLPWLSAQSDNGDINLVPRSDLHAELISANNGDVTIKAAANLTIDEIVGDATWMLVDGLLITKELHANSVELAATKGIVVNNLVMNKPGEVKLNSAKVKVSIDAGGQDQLSLSVSGYGDNSRAQSVSINVENTPRLHITELRTDNGEISVAGDLTLDHADVKDTLVLQTDVLSLYMNNNDLTSKAVDGQFASAYGPFWMITNGNQITTNAQFTRHDADVELNYRGWQADVSDEGSSGYGALSASSQHLNTTRISELLPNPPEIRWIDKIFDWSSFLQGVRIRNRSQSDVFRYEGDKQSDGESISVDDVLAYKQVQGEVEQGEG